MFRLLLLLVTLLFIAACGGGSSSSGGSSSTPEADKPQTGKPLMGKLASSAEVNENETHVALAHTLSDPDALPLAYSIVGGADKALFAIDSSNGDLRFLTAPDYEASTAAGGNDIYRVRIKADNGAGGSVEQNVVIYVINVDDLSAQEDWPIIELPRQVAVNENTLGNIPIACNDPDDGTMWLVVEGDDAKHFTIADNVLRFVTAPDFERPSDSNADNTYSIDVVCFAQYDMDNSRSKMAMDITVNDVVKQAHASIVFPTDNSNLAQGGSSTVTVTVLAEDFESSVLPSFNNANVNGVALVQHASKPKLWTATVPVFQGDNNLVLSATLEGEPVSQAIVMKNTVLTDIDNDYGKKFGLYADADDARLIAVDNLRVLSFPINGSANTSATVLFDNYAEGKAFDANTTAYNPQTNELLTLRYGSDAKLSLTILNLNTQTQSASTVLNMPAAVQAHQFSNSPIAADFDAGVIYLPARASGNSQEHAIYAYSLANQSMTQLFAKADAPLTMQADWSSINAITVDSVNKKLYFTMYNKGFFVVDIATKTVQEITADNAIYTNNSYAKIVLDIANDRAWLKGGAFSDNILEVKLSDGSHGQLLSPGSYMGDYCLLNNDFYLFDETRALHRYPGANPASDSIIYQAGVGKGVGRVFPKVKNLHVNGQQIDFAAHEYSRRGFYSHYMLTAGSQLERLSRYSDENAANNSAIFSPAASTVLGFHSSNKLYILDGGKEDQHSLINAMDSQTTLVNNADAVLLVGNGKLVSFDVKTKQETVISDALGTPSKGFGPVFAPINDAVVVDKNNGLLWLLSMQGLASINLQTGERSIALTPMQMFAETWDSYIDVNNHLGNFSIDADAGFAFVEYKGELLRIKLDDLTTTSVRSNAFAVNRNYIQVGFRGHANEHSQLLWDINHRGVLELESLISGERVAIYQ